MEKIALILAACLFLTGTAACAEDAAKTQTEAPELEMMEFDREVWRGEVTAVDKDSIMLKIIEYNPENPVLPRPELPEGEMPEGIPADGGETWGEPAESAADETIDMSKETDGTDGEESASDISEDGNGIPAEIVSILITDETVYYLAEPGEQEETESEEEDAETSEEDQSAHPGAYYAFEEVAFADVAVGDILTVEIFDGSAAVVVIEVNAAIAEEADM